MHRTDGIKHLTFFVLPEEFDYYCTPVQATVQAQVSWNTFCAIGRMLRSRRECKRTASYEHKYHGIHFVLRVEYFVLEEAVRLLQATSTNTIVNFFIWF
jgi:hypothetical protein